MASRSRNDQRAITCFYVSCSGGLFSVSAFVGFLIVEHRRTSARTVANTVARVVNDDPLPYNRRQFIEIVSAAMVVHNVHTRMGINHKCEGW